MLDSVRDGVTGPAIPISVVTAASYEEWRADLPQSQQAWLSATMIKTSPGSTSLIPGSDGAPAGAVLIVEDTPDLWSFSGLPGALPPGAYSLEVGAGVTLDGELATAASLGWMLGSYRFDRYKTPTDDAPRTLVAMPEADLAHARRLAGAVGLTRDLVNTPANDMGPEELEQAAFGVAEAHDAQYRSIVGDALLEQDYPMIHAVGRASSRAPRLIDLTWGAEDAPKVTLVGKGVCFDSGGLDLKTAAGMLLMKKDMGGAAHVLGLAGAVMDAGLNVRLRVLIPAVENSVSGAAFRPGDVIPTRAGKTVEIGNTDAEGRLILADALAEADSEAPKLVIDVATLTGAARVALGTDMPALFTDDDDFAAELADHSVTESDPLWRLPLWQPYRKQLDTPVADINNISEGPYGGSITAALFLREFLEKTESWAHLDIMAWNRSARPGRPKGGEAVALRAIYALLAERFPA